MKLIASLAASFLLAAPFWAEAKIPTVLDQLDNFLRASESAHSEITRNTEKRIHWAAEPGKPTRFSVVYLHGFSATRQEVMPLPQLVADSLGANIFYTRLTGHGLPGRYMGEATKQDWLDDAREAWEIGSRLGEQVILISVSTGGTLSTWLSAQPFAKDLYAQILISPNFDVASKSAYLLTLPFGLELAQWLAGPERGFEPHNEQQATYWTTRYPLKAVKTLLSLVEEVKAIDKRQIQAPTQIIYSPHDKVVDTSAIESSFALIGSQQKQLQPYRDSKDPSQHCLAGDILSPTSTLPLHDLIITFIKEINH